MAMRRDQPTNIFRRQIHFKCLPFCSIINLLLGWASCQIRKIAGCACTRNAGNVFPATDIKGIPLVSDPGMHRDTCVTHVPWCMSGSLTRGGGEIVPGIPDASATRNFTYLVRGPFRYQIEDWTKCQTFRRLVSWFIDMILPFFKQIEKYGGPPVFSSGF